MSRNIISHYGETIYMTLTEQRNILRNILHKIDNYFRFRYYRRLDYVSVHPPLLGGSSVAAAVGNCRLHRRSLKVGGASYIVFYLVYLIILIIEIL